MISNEKQYLRMTHFIRTGVRRYNYFLNCGQLAAICLKLHRRCNKNKRYFRSGSAFDIAGFMKKVLFIDRDGTIIFDPPGTEKVDSMEALKFLPGAITSLHHLALQTDFELVMVTNQDGLGTDFFPEEKFWPAHNLMLNILNGEGIKFAGIHIDRSFPHDNLSTRKPGTGMLTSYFSAQYDLKKSFVIGDRFTDIELAKNLGCKAIRINGYEPEPVPDNLKPYLALEARNWNAICDFLKNR